MDEAKKKQLGQILLLVGLVIVAVVAFIVMQRNMPGGSGSAAPAAASSTPATNMADAGVTDADRVRAGGVASGRAAASGPKLNPNMWRVYSINPPANPFVEEESWYAATFRQSLPGYPMLKDSGFFDKPGEVLPDLNALFGNDIDFDYAELTRNFDDQTYSLDGTSADGRMRTTLTATEQAPANIEVKYDGDGNIMASEIPGAGGAVSGDSALPPSNGGFFGDTPLPPLSGGAANAGGGGMAVHGVSIHSGRSSALVMFNGTSRIVSVGDDLSAQFAVSKITSGGIEVKNTETGETKFLEIKAASSDDKNPPASMMRGMNL